MIFQIEWVGYNYFCIGLYNFRHERNFVITDFAEQFFLRTISVFQLIVGKIFHSVNVVFGSLANMVWFLPDKPELLTGAEVGVYYKNIVAFTAMGNLPFGSGIFDYCPYLTTSDCMRESTLTHNLASSSEFSMDSC